MATKKTTAREAYQQRQKNIARLLKRINAELEAHARRAAGEPADWGYTGDLGFVQEKLVEITGFLTNNDTPDLEEVLGK